MLAPYKYLISDETYSGRPSPGYSYGGGTADFYVYEEEILKKNKPSMEKISFTDETSLNLYSTFPGLPTNNTIASDYLLMPFQATYERVMRGQSGISEFSELLFSTEWHNQPAYILKKVVNLAITLDMKTTAYELALLGQRIYPQDEGLAHYADVLAPTRILNKKVAPVVSLSASSEWISQNSANYHGLWIAVLDGELLGFDESRKALIKKLGESVHNPGLVVVQVL